VLNARFTQFVKIHRRMMPRRGDSIMMNRNKQPTSYLAPFGEDGSPNVRSRASAVITTTPRIRRSDLARTVDTSLVAVAAFACGSLDGTTARYALSR
jgi:hypothetical protein